MAAESVCGSGASPLRAGTRSRACGWMGCGSTCTRYVSLPFPRATRATGMHAHCVLQPSRRGNACALAKLQLLQLEIRPGPVCVRH
eukprot:3725542-Rhodomonas_salina.4